MHARRTLDRVLAQSPDAFVMLDLDLRNAFPSLEWEAIRAAVQAKVPSLGTWTAWCHSHSATVHLPDGAQYECDQGAEQGDPLGPVYCALTLIAVVEKHLPQQRLMVVTAGMGGTWTMA